MDRWDKINEMEKLKIHTKFQLDTVRGTSVRKTDTLEDLGPIKILKGNVKNWTQIIKIAVAFRSVKYKFLLRYTRSANGTNISVRVTIL